MAKNKVEITGINTNNLRRLKQNNIIERIGTDRNGYFKIL